MPNLRSALRTSLATLVLSGVSAAGGAEWLADFDAAQKLAKESGKDLLVDFTGSDWCGWCIRLDNEVFSQDAFAKGVQADFVLVALDFPNGEEARAKVPNPARNAALQEQHGVFSFPTILLMTAQGDVYGRTGYQRGGPEAYVKHLGELRQSGKQALADVNARLAAFAVATGEARLVAWDALADLAQSLGGSSPFTTRFVGPLEAAFTFDPAGAGATERRLRAAELLLALGQTSETLLKAARELDPKNERGLLEKTVALRFGRVQDVEDARAAIAALREFDAQAKFKDAELAVQLYGTAALWLAQHLDDAAGAKVWAKKALDLEPKDEGIRQALQELLDA